MKLEWIMITTCFLLTFCNSKSERRSEIMTNKDSSKNDLTNDSIFDNDHLHNELILGKLIDSFEELRYYKFLSKSNVEKLNDTSLFSIFIFDSGNCRQEFLVSYNNLNIIDKCNILYECDQENTSFQYKNFKRLDINRWLIFEIEEKLKENYSNIDGINVLSETVSNDTIAKTELILLANGMFKFIKQ